MKNKILTGLAIGLMLIGSTGIASAKDNDKDKDKDRDSNGVPFTQLQRQINELQKQLDTLQLNGGKGDQGPTGLTGPQGVQGPTGLTGATGPKGDTGDQGLQGVAGPQGVQGFPGSDGTKGDKGDTGDQGLIGLTGPQGEQGLKGDTGLTGAVGLKGDQGGQGIQGPIGPQGFPGSDGMKGDKGDTGPAGIFPTEIDRTPPVITTTAPLVASSSYVTFTTTISDDVELAYITKSNTPAGQFVFVAEDIKEDQAGDGAYVNLGETYSKTLMAVDTSGNVTKKTITMTTPETGIKIGTYSTVGTYSLPAGFNCLTGWGAMYGTPDGSSVIGVAMRPATFYGQQIWSEADGYTPVMEIEAGSYSISLGEQPLGPPTTPPTPLSATSFTIDSPGGSGYTSDSGSSYSFESRYTASATLSKTNPTTMDITLNMSCNENNTGFVNGNTATFQVSLVP